MTSSECFRCGSPASNTFGNGYICDDCAPESGVSFIESKKSSENGSDTKSETDSTSADTVPTSLDELGEAFVPIPPREKGTRRPRTPENLFASDDPVFEAYLEAGHNYGIACRGDLAVIDADEPERLRELLDALPATAWQVSGSRSSEHHFLRVPGLDEDIPLVDPEADEDLGHIKGAKQSYVVGPGSMHLSGNRYGPLQGDEIATVDEDDLRELIDPFRPDGPDRPVVDPGAVDRDRDTGVDLSVHDVISRSRHPEEKRTEHPFHGSDTGANFMVDDGAKTWRCWRHDCTGNALHLVGIEEGVISCGDWTGTGLNSDTWSKIFDAAREAEYDLPEYDPTGASDAEPKAVLPNLTEWDWRQAGQQAAADDGALSMDTARERTQRAIEDAYESFDHVLVEALPTLGKSHGAIAAAAEVDEPITVLTGRGRKEQYGQIREWCDEYGLKHYTLPSFTYDCDTANGEHGEEWANTVMDWYRRGATPQDIHKHAENELGRPLPCHERGECPYALKWDFDSDAYDVLIGHYSHAHKSKVTKGRTVVFDEFPDAYETILGDGLEGAISYFLASHDGVPFDDHADLLENRSDEQQRADALLWFDEREVDTDSLQVFSAATGHALAPLAVFTLLASEDLGNGWECADLGDGRTGLYDRENGRICLLTPPTDMYERSLVALDGTPTVEMWETVLGTRFSDRRQVLSDAERREYIEDTLGLQLIRTTDAVKSYSPGESEIEQRVSLEQDTALLKAIADEHGDRPALITTARAEGLYDREGVLDLVDGIQHYGNVLGSNQFASTRLGAVIGSRNFGPNYVEKWGAYLGETIEPTFPSPENDFTPTNYGEVGNRIRTHMREHETLQAAMRFGRDGNGATVYVHTDTLPEWVPIAGEGRVLQTWSDGMRQVIGAARDLEEWTTAEIAAHPDVEIGERQVRDHLTTLADRGYVDREVEGCGFVWRDDGLYRVNDHGEVELAPVDIVDLSDEESAELARMTINTWEFRTSGADDSRNGGAGRSGSVAADQSALNGGDPPPDEAD